MHGDSPTVLAVDDDRGLVDLYEAWLTNDYSVRTACNGEEGLASLDEAVDVVVLDRDMPVVSGDEFLVRCRRDAWDGRVLMVSGKQPTGDVLELGFDAYLTKPVARQTLLSHVSMLLRRQRYSCNVKEYFAIASKLALLNEHELDTQARTIYDGLRDRRRTLGTRIDQLLGEFDQRDIEAEYPQLSAPSPAD